MKNQCEDFPCCGHELNDCNGEKYGTDQSIKERYWNSLLRGDYPEDDE